MNRVDDSLAIWSDVVSSPLLASVSLVLFLNKMDLLERKLAAGVRVGKYFGDYKSTSRTTTDEFEQVWRYFRSVSIDARPLRLTEALTCNSVPSDSWRYSKRIVPLLPRGPATCVASAAYCCAALAHACS